MKTPLYEAKVQPDIYFFGFDLTADAARGGATVHGEEDPGWFFVIKERPGEPRFGLDLPQDSAQTAVASWNELSWTDVVDGYDTAEQLPVGQHDVAVVGGAVDPTQQAQHDEDARVPLACRHERRRARLHPLPAARPDGRPRRRDAQEGWGVSNAGRLR